MLVLAPFLLTSSLITGSLAATFNVDVGKDGLTFSPNQVTANPDDEIIFHFYPKNHTLTQSTLAQPCAPLSGGGDTGYVPVAADIQDSERPTRKLVVPQSTAPLWFYCAQGNHCQQRMVFAINPGDKMDQFLANAAAGGAAPPPATSSTTSTPPASQSSTPVAPTTSTAPPTPSSPPTGGGREILIDVGVNAAGQTGLVFTPDRATAAVGDAIVFTFKGGAHTATQSTFAQPCSPLANGFDSGPKPAAGLTSGFPNATFPVTDISKPIWFYCATGNHCQQGMVFSLNAPATGNTADEFKRIAMGGTPNTNTNTTTPETTPGDGASSVAGHASALFIAAATLAGLLL